MRLTKKHFDLVAGALAQARSLAAARSPAPDVPELAGVDTAAEALADVLAGTNSGFDRQRFLDACHHGQLALGFGLLESATTS
jgi:hypothetical protein